MNAPFQKISKAPSIRRMPAYLHKLVEMSLAGTDIVGAPELARYMQCSEIAVRKDLAITGVSGQPGVGYKVGELIDAIRRFLNWDSVTEAVLVGAGSLGSALLGYEWFEECGLHIVCAFDAAPEKVGTFVHGKAVYALDRLCGFVRENRIRLGIICVPAQSAQDVADRMVEGGIRGIWNFANVRLKLPDDVVMQREVIAGGLAELSVKIRRNDEADGQQDFSTERF